jgi:hypothetical protein
MRPDNKGNQKESFNYPSFNSEGYLTYFLSIKSGNKKKQLIITAQRLSALVFNNSNLIFRNTNADYIDRKR